MMGEGAAMGVAMVGSSLGMMKGAGARAGAADFGRGGRMGRDM